MTDVVPWVPYLWSFATHITGPTVTQWDFDQFTGRSATRTLPSATERPCGPTSRSLRRLNGCLAFGLLS